MKIISASYVIPISTKPIYRGAIAVDNGRICAVGTASELLMRYPSATEEQHNDCVLMPGLVNAHLEPDLTNFAPPSTPSTTREGEVCLHTHWQKHALHYLQETRLDTIASAVEQSFAFAKQAGITCVGASSNYEGCTDMLARSGLRGVVFPQVFASSSSDMTQDRFESALGLLDKFAEKPSDRIRIGAGPVAPYMVSRQLLMILAQHAHELGAPCQIRAAESFEEIEFFYNSSGPIGSDIFPLLGWGETLPPAFQKTPIQYLHDIGLLDTKPSIVGCLHLRKDDYGYLAESGSSAIFTPQAISAFNLGEFPYGRLHESGINVGLGTKPGLEPCKGNLWNEMRAALEMGGLTSEDILYMATMGSAQALHLGEQIGSLDSGKHADYIVLRTPGNHSERDLLDALVSTTTPADITQVVIAGNAQALG